MTDWRDRRVLVTGATGFVGGALAVRLIDAGARVAVLARRPDAAPRGARVVAGALSDAGALAEACRDAEVVFHCAARPADSGAVADFYVDNVEGTLRLARAAAAAGCARFVFASSISVYGFEPPPEVDEATPVSADRLGGSYPYAESKIVAERMLPFAAAGSGMEWVTARVGSVFGPGSYHWTERPVRVMSNGPFGMIYVDGGRGLHNYVYIDNLIDGLLLAGGHPAAARGVFDMTDGCVSYRDFFDPYTRMLRGRVRVRQVSPRQALALAFALERIARARGRAPMITRIAVRLLLRRARISSDRARDLLGWQPRVGFDEGMAACERWLAERGLLG